MIAVIRPDLLTDIYVDECKINLMVRAARPFQTGESVMQDDIVDIGSMVFAGVEVPRDAAVVCVLSVGWRKGLFFDFMPFQLDAPSREYDLWNVLGSCFAYLTNQQVFKLDELQWKLLFRQGWFPFISLPKFLMRQIIASVRSGLSINSHIEAVSSAIRGMAPQIRSRWSEAGLLQDHLPLLERALDRFLEGDYLSTTSILYPRIEGILRSMHTTSGSAQNPRQVDLAQAAVDPWINRVHEYSWLLPQKFKDYLEKVYFAGFTPGQSAPLSRNSVGHGVASTNDFDQEHACIALLIVDQLRFLLPIEQTHEITLLRTTP
jgi:hypothetical protein